ncbi:LuxR family transcriptional regulator [Sphingomonas endophytica]|uniref:LuxR family transcriptional regulator n=2 Tax=Sphingomonas endophytica TaxID=869719 RepID=A0A147I5T5_9SPHN|nr:LuxR family transcriptional regulator [Sphingomonas endophytica]
MVPQQRSGGRVLVADDHPLSREGLALAARAALGGATTVGVGSVVEAQAALETRLPYRMILLDLFLPDASGFSGLLTLQMYARGTPIVLVTASEEPRLAGAARALGAAGYLYKSLALDQIAQRLRRIDAGETSFPSTTPEASGVREARERIAALSNAQRGVLMALADGRANKQIAHDLAISEATVKAHMTAVFRKLGVTNRAQALLAIQPLIGGVVR